MRKGDDFCDFLSHSPALGLEGSIGQQRYRRHLLVTPDGDLSNCVAHEIDDLPHVAGEIGGLSHFVAGEPGDLSLYVAAEPGDLSHYVAD